MFELLKNRFGSIEQAYEIHKLAVINDMIEDVKICIYLGAGYNEIKNYIMCKITYNKNYITCDSK